MPAIHVRFGPEADVQGSMPTREGLVMLSGIHNELHVTRSTTLICDGKAELTYGCLRRKQMEQEMTLVALTFRMP